MVHLYVDTVVEYSASAALSIRLIAAAEARGHGLWPVVIQPHVYRSSLPF